VLAVTAAGLFVAGAAASTIQSARVDARVDAALAQEVAEFRSLAEAGVDPRSGEPFPSIEELFFVTLQRNVPDGDEGLLTLVDGEVAYYSPGGRPVQLERLPEIVAAARRLTAEDGVRLDTVDTAIGEVRYAAVPVTVTGEASTGVYVVGIAREVARQDVTDTSRTFALIAVLTLGMVALISWLVAGRLLAPVRALRDTAQRIGETALDERIAVSGHDDISELARTFNGMLDRLEHAFSTQRQLLDDVGHELRTPITIVRGHLELMDGADPHDVGETRALVLDELDRMNRLVDDLLLLAKARRPDFLRWGVVSVADLVDDVLDKARALAERNWQVEARAGGEVSGDAQRLTQALLQLAANAARYTGPGDLVALGSATAGSEVRLWVRDTGPGVAEEDRERIFTRFARGRGARGAEGAGLGLPIVAAIAEAHGGRIELATAPGEGATFAVVLPRGDEYDAGGNDRTHDGQSERPAEATPTPTRRARHTSAGRAR
jgi:signal transduction histidine kinase